MIRRLDSLGNECVPVGGQSDLEERSDSSGQVKRYAVRIPAAVMGQLCANKSQKVDAADVS